MEMEITSFHLFIEIFFLLFEMIFKWHIIYYYLKDVRIRRLTEEKNELCDQLRRVKLDLEEERTKSIYRDRPLATSTQGSPNGPVGDLPDWQSKYLY